MVTRTISEWKEFMEMNDLIPGDKIEVNYKNRIAVFDVSKEGIMTKNGNNAICLTLFVMAGVAKWMKS